MVRIHDADARPAPKVSGDALAFLVGLRELAQEIAWARNLDEERLEDPACRRQSIQLAADCAARALALLRTHADAAASAAIDTDEFDWEFAPERGTHVEPAHVPDTAAIAFVAGFALRARLTALQAAMPDDRWQVLAGADGIAREIERTLTAIERALGLSSSDDPRSRAVLEAVRIRNAYVVFGDAVAVGRPPREAEILARLRLAGTAIVKLVGDPIYPALRVGDRRIIRTFHDRILTWLRAGAGDTIGGIRLWRDLANMVELIMGVNKRPELASHDVRLLRECIAAIEADANDGGSPRAMDLLGRDAELDRALRQQVRGRPLRDAMARALAAIVREDTHPDQPGVEESIVAPAARREPSAEG